MKKEEERKIKNKGNNINNQEEDVKHSDVSQIVIYNYLLFNCVIYNYLVVYICIYNYLLFNNILLFNCNIYIMIYYYLIIFYE